MAKKQTNPKSKTATTPPAEAEEAAKASADEPANAQAADQAEAAAPEANTTAESANESANEGAKKAGKKGSGQRRKALGRGLGALLSPEEEEEPVQPEQSTEEALQGVQMVALEQIEANPYQPRNDFGEEALQELADSIRVQGIIQPITLRRIEPGRFQLIAGERRTRAAKMAGMTEVPAFVREANDEQMLEIALIENVQRHDLNPIEVALAYSRLMEECDLVIEQVGEKVGKKRATVNNYLRLLKLPPEIQTGLRDGLITMGHARALITVDNPVEALSIYRATVKKGLSVRKVEELVRQLGQKQAAKNTGQEAPTAYELQVREVQKNLENRFGTKVQIQTSQQGSGEIKLKFYSSEDLNRILEQLGEEQS
jgi:ParB family chromosome partitioning protein